MSTTPPPAPEQAPPSGPDGGHGAPAGGPRSGPDLHGLGSLRRSRTDRKVAGVAGGLGRHLDVDPTILRVAFVVLTLFGGAGILLYAAAWLLVPEDGSDRGPIDLEPTLRTIVLAVVAVFAVVVLFGHTFGVFDFPWPLALVGLVVLAVLAGQGRLSRPRASGPPPGWVPPGSPGGPVSLDKEQPAASGAPWSGAHGWAPPTPSYAGHYAPPPAPPTPPRRRGPRLLLPTLALIALGWGVLWLVDLGSADVPASGYAALALAVCGLMLVVGAWFGRALGVVFLGVLAAVALGITRVADGGVGERVDVAPTTSAALADGYSMKVGRMTVDLTTVADPAALDGRTLTLDGNVGRIAVIVPPGLDVTASATADGGQVDLFGRQSDGDDLDVTESVDGGAGSPHLTIDADLDFGQITMRTR